MGWPYSFSCFLTVFLLLLFKCESQGRGQNSRKLNSATLNQKAVGLVLKANGKRYYVSSELCPGGVFLTRPVNENCLCYNGIFQIVRECCSPRHTRIHSDNLEWRMGFKCGTSPEVGNGTDHHPIRAILPLSKPHNRFSSMIITRSLVGNNTSKWRKFDMDDIIIGNDGQVDMSGKMQFEIVNIKPLGREIEIMFGKSSNMAVCYSGWLTDEGHQNLRVRISEQGETQGCCFKLTRANSQGELRVNCSTGSIIAEVIDVQSADIDIGQCNQDVPDEAPHTINKRNPTVFQKTRFIPGGVAWEAPLNYQESRNIDDFLGDRGPILIKREVTKSKGTSDGTTIPTVEGNGLQLESDVILPRRKGISRASGDEQAQAINEFIAILRNDINVDIREPQTPRFQLLRKSFDIFLKVIPNEVVPNMLVKTAFDVFFFLFEELEPVIYTPPELFNKTMNYLDTCLNKEEMLNFSTTGCPQQVDKLIIDTSVKAKLEGFYKDQPEDLKRVLKSLNNVNIRKDKRFVPELHDIYVEINWKVADFVHSICFDYFGKEFNAHTFFESEMETLFLFDDVQKRWFTPRENLRYVRGIFPVSDLKMSMKQLDKVTAIVHHLSRYNGTYWLERPQQIEGAPDRMPIVNYAGSEPNSEARLIFAKNLLEDAQIEASNERTMRQYGRSGTEVSSAERSLTYPFQFPDKLPAGEVIWDGMAVCLHAAYSNSRSYFVESDMWGVTPSLLELGQWYP